MTLRGPPLAAPRTIAQAADRGCSCGRTPLTIGGSTRSPAVNDADALSLRPWGVHRIPECTRLSLHTTPLDLVWNAVSADDSRPDVAPPTEARLAAGGVPAADEIREMSRLAVVVAVIVLVFALVSLAIVVETGDPASAAAGAVQMVIIVALVYARRQLRLGRTDRGVVLIVVSVLAACLVMAAIPPPVPALAAAPLIAVAFSLSLFHGRRLRAALIAVWIVAIVIAIIVEFTPPSPDLPPEVAAASRVATFAAVVGLVVLVLYRHRRRLEGAMNDVQTTGIALRASEERYRLLFDGLVDAVFLHETTDDGLPGRIVAVNDVACRRLGYERDELLRMTVADIDAPDSPVVPQDVVARLQRGEQVLFEQTHVARDGRLIPVEVNTRTFQLQARPVVLAVARDISDRRRAEQELQQRDELLRQAQKMELVGRLAGGVAHDFNNMLGVILGNTELALAQVDPAQPAHADLLEIQDAAERSTDLTRQLLAFARKTAVVPAVLDLNETVSGLLPMLQRLIGENVQLAWCPGADVWPVVMDPSQVDQILVNLCLNARDAIADVGTITIGTANCAIDAAFCASHADAVPGEHARLTVSDTGRGMDRDVLDHVFEPFYTTKGVGEGTGLGLATVHGSLLQNHGFITVSSAPGHGSTFEIYLPRDSGQGESPRPAGALDSSTGGLETILLVEDEPAMLRLATRALEAQGYTVLAAGGPTEAIRLATDHADEIRLLVTDVLMPGMNGRDLADALSPLHPGLACVFMSGHAADTMTAGGTVDEGTCFIQKPFSLHDLSAKVREALDDVPDRLLDPAGPSR